MKIGRVFSGLGIGYSVFDLLVRKLGDLDFIVGLLSSEESDPHWILKVSEFIGNSPEYLPYTLIAVGFLYLFYDNWITRRATSTMVNTPIVGAEDQVTEAEDGNTDKPASEPSYSAWGKSDVLTIWDAAHLWAEQEPIADHPGGPAPFRAIFEDLKAGVDAGRINRKIDVFSSGGDQRADRYTRIERAELERYALKHRNERPKFLFPEERDGGNKTLKFTAESYSKLWERNNDFMLEQAACLWVEIEPFHPVPPGTKPNPVLDRLIAAADEGSLETREGNPGEPWSRRATHDQLIDYCIATRQRPEFLFPFPEAKQTVLVLENEDGNLRIVRGNSFKSWGGTNPYFGDFLDAMSTDPIFYVSENASVSWEIIRIDKMHVEFRIESYSETPIKITFD